MKVNAQIFAGTLGMVLPLCKNRSTLPILTCVKLQATSGRLAVTATDLDAFATAGCLCEGDLEPVCVDSLALQFLIGIAEGDVDLLVENKRLVVNGAGVARLGIQPAEEFPTWPQGGCKVIGVNGTDLAKCLKGVAWAAECNDKFNVDMWKECVLVQTHPKAIECTGTNTKEFAHVYFPAIAAESRFLFPSKHAELLIEALDLKDSVVEVGDTWVSVTADDFSVAVKLAEDRYPNIKIVLEAEAQPLGTLDLGGLQESFGTLKALNHWEPFIGCSLVFAPEKVTVKYAGKAGSFSRTLAAKGNKLERSINLDAVRAFKVFHYPSDQAKAVLGQGVIRFHDGDYTYALALMKDDK